MIIIFIIIFKRSFFLSFFPFHRHSIILLLSFVAPVYYLHLLAINATRKRGAAMSAMLLETRRAMADSEQSA